MTRDIIPDLTTTDPAATSKIAVLPVGAFEQHGPYLPLGTDTLIACAVTTAITKHHRVLQLPPVTFGCSHEHAAYPGTVSIGAATLTAIVTDITQSLTHQQIRGLIVVNAHGGNAVLTNVVQHANQSAHQLKLGLYPSREDWAEARTAAGVTSSNHDDMHAGELETSILLAAHPDYLRDGWASSDHSATDRRYLTTLGIGPYTPTGVIGYPSQATAAKGRAALDHLGRNVATLIDLLAPPPQPEPTP
ncbi:creatininase family protein [Mycobacterium kansasii]|uniref:Creatinine amidohydrolase family protein n=3 Tax=Mycobacterium kansasii TaxID=1768 RepID=A0A1V3WXW6_MYCKA|nr:creatininase family protein [Mycobacterium kansasii]AGZ49283.1 creatinine amidohydrolase [Mycobacterium kansasii ATCC 12478]ARG58757.1 creatinine amidohydrolase [Mycobacterium kansasii]ARG64272.1 creatinine amidohydrolase [Mycobacterium kansasii]ARG71925.1 creatinine amidohydrolase [Mycobacterium kansasii]ARG73573.1 creatinine amidohydrolase [Mycobacterium kansasii]